MSTPAPPAPATTTTASEYEEDDSETKEEDGGELGRGNFIGSADDDGRIGQQTEERGSSIRRVGEGERSRDEARRCDIPILLLIDSEILLQNDNGERNKCMWGLSR